MINLISFLAEFSLTAYAVIVGVVALVILLFSIFFIWWVDTKKRPFKEFWGIVGDAFARFFGDIFSVFHRHSTVKTVYSDKSLNYSGTEFLPIPTKAPTNQFSYEFVGWDKNGVDSEGNTVVRAIYLQKVMMCTISVFDSDGTTLLATYHVEYGSGVNLDGLKPQKQDTKEFTYEFVGWDKKTSEFYKDEKICAVYNAIPKKYTYKFFEEDGLTVVSQGTAIYGTPIVPPTPPKKETDAKGVYEFDCWKGYEGNTILVKDMNFFASYKLKHLGGVGSSSIIKNTNNVVKIVEETNLTSKEDSHHDEIKKAVSADSLNFDTVKNEAKQEVTEIKVGSSGVIRKRNGGFVQMNSDVEKFEKINKSVEGTNTDKDVHQKIQLMTVKQSAEVAPTKAEENKIITLKPKKTTVTENDIIGNIMTNRVKIDKKK